VVKDGKAEIHKLRVTRDFSTWVEAGAGVRSGERAILNSPVTLRQLPCLEPNAAFIACQAVSDAPGQLEMRYGR
jgi:hypothetical protein